MEIAVAVEEQINEYQTKTQRLREAMQAHIERKHHGERDTSA